LHTPHSLLLCDPHLAPHSFPTRRSSDLSDRPCIDVYTCAPRAPCSEIARSTAARPRSPSWSAVCATQPVNRSGCAATSWPSSWLDRKSTRLNSSHQIISYAVFCLKKKKH